MDSSSAAENGIRKKPQNAATGASAAGMRALSSQVLAFYFRAPIKAFFRARVEAINPGLNGSSGWSWKTTTPGLLAHAVRERGWGFIPNQVLPPLLANVTVGAVLYTSYLQTLAVLHEPSAHSAKRSFPPPPVLSTFAAGFTAGAIQSLVAAPLDALQVRFQKHDMLQGTYKSMWHYGADKLRSIGLRGVFTGYTLSFIKDSLGSGVFFATFEYLKSQSYYSFIQYYYSHRFEHADLSPLRIRPSSRNDGAGVTTIKPHYTIEPVFLLFAGIAASTAQQFVQHPLTAVQDLHFGHLESLDYASTLDGSRQSMMRHYYQAYRETYKQCRMRAKLEGSWRRWFYRNFWSSTLRQVPATSAGLIVFELVRRKYGEGDGAVVLARDVL